MQRELLLQPFSLMQRSVHRLRESSQFERAHSLQAVSRNLRLGQYLSDVIHPGNPEETAHATT
jgi:hypothetical protein